jgi:hypothetical protein
MPKAPNPNVRWFCKSRIGRLKRNVAATCDETVFNRVEETMADVDATRRSRRSPAIIRTVANPTPANQIHHRTSTIRMLLARDAVTSTTVVMLPAVALGCGEGLGLISREIVFTSSESQEGSTRLMSGVRSAASNPVVKTACRTAAD